MVAVRQSEVMKPLDPFTQFKPVVFWAVFLGWNALIFAGVAINGFDAPIEHPISHSLFFFACIAMSVFLFAILITSVSVKR